MPLIAILLIAVAMASLVFYQNSRGNNKSTGNARTNLTIIVSFNPIYYLVRPVVGNSTKILQIIGPGVEPHEYEPTPSDIETLSEGSIFFYDGPALENWAVQLADSVNKNIELVPLINAINLSQLNNNSDIILQDPHFWLDPAIMPTAINYIKDKMIVLDPANATIYTENANVFVTKIDQLDAAYKAGLSHCQSRTVIDSHAFLGYLAISYNLTEEPISGESPSQEPSAAKVAGMIYNGTKDKTKAVFIEVC